MGSNSIAVSDIRDTNRKIVLRAVWRFQPVSRADLSRYTRINKASISSIVAGLIEEGLVREERSESTQVGRTPYELTIANDGKAFLAVDVRPRRVTVALYNLSGSRLAMSVLKPGQRTRHPSALLEAICGELVQLCESNRIKPQKVAAIGMAVPGQVDRHSGTVIRAPILDWVDLDVQDTFGRLFPRASIEVDNSAILAFRAEHHKGHSLPDTFTGVYLDINETVQTARMLDGKTIGYNNMGSFGRMRVIVDGDKVGKALEELISLPALLEAFRGPSRRKRGNPRAELLKLKEAYLDGDPLARDAVEREAEWLAIGISNIFLTLGLPAVVVGGHIRAIWDLLQETVFMRCATLTDGQFPGRHEIRLSSLAELETLEGAALAAIGTIIPLDLISMLTNTQKQIIESRVAVR